jgi:hypothetical protein
MYRQRRIVEIAGILLCGSKSAASQKNTAVVSYSRDRNHAALFRLIQEVVYRRIIICVV